MSYTIRWDKKALADLGEMGKIEAKRIAKKIETHLSRDPVSLGKPLTGNFRGLYRYILFAHQELGNSLPRRGRVGVGAQVAKPVPQPPPT